MAVIRDFAVAVSYAGGATPLEVPLNAAYKNVQISLVGLNTDGVTIKGKAPAETTGVTTVTPAYDTISVDAGVTTVKVSDYLLDSLEFSGAIAGSYGIVVHAWK